jgi:hypothetical protein
VRSVLATTEEDLAGIMVHSPAASGWEDDHVDDLNDDGEMPDMSDE